MIDVNRLSAADRQIAPPGFAMAIALYLALPSIRCKHAHPRASTARAFEQRSSRERESAPM